MGQHSISFFTAWYYTTYVTLFFSSVPKGIEVELASSLGWFKFSSLYTLSELASYLARMYSGCFSPFFNSFDLHSCLSIASFLFFFPLSLIMAPKTTPTKQTDNTQLAYEALGMQTHWKMPLYAPSFTYALLLLAAGFGNGQHPERKDALRTNSRTKKPITILL